MYDVCRVNTIHNGKNMRLLILLQFLALDLMARIIILISYEASEKETDRLKYDHGRHYIILNQPSGWTGHVQCIVP